MLDGEVPEEVEMVWGFALPTMPNGRRKWPEALRAMAVERIEAGASVREIAEEIGAHKSLVAVWVKNARSGDAVHVFRDPAADVGETGPQRQIQPTRGG